MEHWKRPAAGTRQLNIGRDPLQETGSGTLEETRCRNQAVEHWKRPAAGNRQWNIGRDLLQEPGSGTLEEQSVDWWSHYRHCVSTCLGDQVNTGNWSNDTKDQLSEP